MSNFRYEELGSLGRGGFGEVFLAKDRELGREVALKRPFENLQDQELEEFHKEARATAGLDHPSIPYLYEKGQDDEGRPFLALKLVAGKTLEKLIEELNLGDAKIHAQYPYHQRVAVFLKVCEAVAYAHERGYVHRDLKPANIMVGDLGEVFVLDWGLAKSEPALNEAAPDSGALFKGTPLYAAPEIINGEPASSATDLYSLGATLYEWLGLKPAFEEKQLGKLLMAVMNDTPKSVNLHNHPVQGRVPIELGRIVESTMGKSKDKRPESVRAFADQLRDWLNGEIQPMCPCTTVKYSFRLTSGWMDNFPLLATPVVILWLLYPAVAAIQWLLDRFFWHV